MDFRGAGNTVALPSASTVLYQPAEMDEKQDFAPVVRLVREAGAAIMAFHRKQPKVEVKGDGSPLSEADLAAHRVLDAGLRELFPQIPVVSEEAELLAFEERQKWPRFWLVDPLDGTREFLREDGAFTVNVALVEGQVPAWGCVFAPRLDWMYHGGEGRGAWKATESGVEEKITVAALGEIGSRPFRFVASKSHRGAEVSRLVERFPDAELLSMGSSLKFCLIAEGRADLYLRDVPTMEWDTAAADAVLRAAGGCVRTYPQLAPLAYNKASLKNPFLAAGTEAVIDAIFSET